MRNSAALQSMFAYLDVESTVTTLGDITVRVIASCATVFFSGVVSAIRCLLATSCKMGLKRRNQDIIDFILL